MAGRILFRCNVKPGYQATDPGYAVWLAAQKKGSFTKEHCTCKAELEESCSHIAALMFKLEAVVRLGFTNMACTSLPFSWNNLSTTKVNCAPIRNIIFYKPKEGKAKKRPKPFIPLSAESKQSQYHFGQTKLSASQNSD